MKTYQKIIWYSPLVLSSFLSSGCTDLEQPSRYTYQPPKPEYTKGIVKSERFIAPSFAYGPSYRFSVISDSTFTNFCCFNDCNEIDLLIDKGDSVTISLPGPIDKPLFGDPNEIVVSLENIIRVNGIKVKK